MKFDIHPHGIVYHFFTSLREAGYKLGIDEYKLAIDAFKRGFGFSSDERAKLNVFKMLWLTSPLDEPEFEQIYLSALLLCRIELSSNKGSIKDRNESFNTNPSDVSNPAEELTSHKKPIIEPESINTESEDLIDSISYHSKNDDEFNLVNSHYFQEGKLYDLDKIKIQGYSNSKLHYLPISRRRLQQSWRFLRRITKVNGNREIDFEETIRKMCENNGNLLYPKMKSENENASNLIILLDIEGSMVAFHKLGERLHKTSKNAGLFRRISHFYFHNTPERFLYKDTGMKFFEESHKVFQGNSIKNTFVIIFSDAGAARGSMNPERIRDTDRYIQVQIRPYVNKIVWINPMPARRWKGSSAFAIRAFIEMYEATPQGFSDAIDYLRGKLMSYVRI